MVIMAVHGESEDVEDIVEEATLVGLEADTILSLLVSMGFVAIWHVTVPDRHPSCKVEAVGPLLEIHQDLGGETQGIEEKEVDSRFV